MDVSHKTSWSYGNYTLDISRPLKPEDKNQVYLISFLASEIRNTIGKLPFCEIRQLPYRDKVVHYINDPDAQKLIETFHRYGYVNPPPQKACPFQSGELRPRFTSWVGENNLMSAYEDKSAYYRNSLIAFFKKQKLEDLKVEWKKITQEWLCQQVQKSETNLFDASLYLIGKCLIKGMLDYDQCTEEDVKFNTEYWKDKFALSGDELKTLEEHKLDEPKKDTQTTHHSLIDSFYQYSLDLFSSWVQSTSSSNQKSSGPDVEFQQLARKIYYQTISKPQSLCYFLAKKNWSEEEIIEHVKIFLLAGQETVGYLLGFMFYEYSKNPSMQENKDSDSIKNAYLETLRLYSVGGSLREARTDMVLSQNQNGVIKELYIRKGDRINCGPYFNGYDPTVWENPETFNSQRPDLENVRNNPHFGHGPHRCIGEKAAQVELAEIVHEVLINATLSTQDKLPDLLDAFTWRPQNEIKVKFILDWMSIAYPRLSDVPQHLRSPAVYLSYVKKDGIALDVVPESERTYQLCLAAIQNDATAISHVPSIHLIPELYLTAFKKYGGALGCIPWRLRTPEMYMPAILQQGTALESVPEKYRTKEMCELAVNQDPRALEFVPMDLRSVELCEKAVDRYPLALAYVPKDKKTPELCWKAVRKNVDAFKFVPEELMTEDMCLFAVGKRGHLLQYIPEHKRTQAVCLDAVKNFPLIFSDVPLKFQTPKMYLDAVSNCPIAIEEVSRDKRNDILYTTAVKANGSVLGRLSEEERTEPLCYLSVENNPWSLRDVPINLRSKKLCEMAVQKNGSCLEFVPDDLRTLELCKVAVREDGLALKFVPDHLRIPELCLIAVQQNPWAIGFVPEELRTPKLCLEAVTKDGGILSLVPKKLKEYDLCLTAVRNYREAIEHVPEEFKTPEMYIAAKKERDIYSRMNKMLNFVKTGGRSINYRCPFFNLIGVVS